MPYLLDQIVAGGRPRIDQLRARRGELERTAQGAAPVPDFAAALGGDRVALIAEVKRRSPSAGVISLELDPTAHAERYADAGAAAISVLTEGPHFGGSVADLVGVRERVGVPVLRKDFIVDEVQLLETRAIGASAALLIVRILTPARLAALIAFARDLRLATLVETHTRAEIDVALTAGAEIIGVNSRDLDTFALDPDKAWEMLALVPSALLAVAESAMQTVVDVEKAAAAGADAVLIGTALSSAADPAPLVRQFTSVTRRAR